MSFLAFVVTAIGLGASFVDDSKIGDRTQEARKKAIANGDRWYYDGRMIPTETKTGRDICFRRDFKADVTYAYDLKTKKMLWCETNDENKKKTAASIEEAEKTGKLFYRYYGFDSDSKKIIIYKTRLYPDKLFEKMPGNVPYFREVIPNLTTGKLESPSRFKDCFNIFDDGVIYTDEEYKRRLEDHNRSEAIKSGKKLYKINDIYKHVDTGEVYTTMRFKAGFVRLVDKDNHNAVTIDIYGEEI